MTLEIEAGKFYKAANGEKVGPMSRLIEFGYVYWEVIGNCESHMCTILWRNDGSRFWGENDGWELVSEWEEPLETKPNDGPDYLYNLGLKEGDVVQLDGHPYRRILVSIDGELYATRDGSKQKFNKVSGSKVPEWRVISRASDTVTEDSEPEVDYYNGEWHLWDNSGDCPLVDGTIIHLLYNDEVCKNRTMPEWIWSGVSKGDSVQAFKVVGKKPVVETVEGTVEMTDGVPNFDTWEAK